jgi:hypothetical protein
MQSQENPHPDQSLRALEARLRALPEPAVPAGLEARLLAAIPNNFANDAMIRAATNVPTDVSSDFTVERQGWIAVASVILALVTVCLLAVFGSGGRDGGESLVAIHGVSLPASQNRPRPIDELTDVVLSPLDERILERAGLSKFRWPIQETPRVKASYSIPRDLAD